MIKFNEVTWYSRWAAIIFFIGVLPALAFYIGVQYEKVASENKIVVTKSVSVSTGTTANSTLTDAQFIAATSPDYRNGGGAHILAKGDANQDGYEDAIVMNLSCGAGCIYYLRLVLNEDNKLAKVISSDFDGVNGSPAAFKSSISTITINGGIISITGSGLDCSLSDLGDSKDCIATEDNMWPTSKTINYRFDGTKILRLN